MRRKKKRPSPFNFYQSPKQLYERGLSKMVTRPEPISLYDRWRKIASFAGRYGWTSTGGIDYVVLEKRNVALEISYSDNEIHDVVYRVTKPGQWQPTIKRVYVFHNFKRTFEFVKTMVVLV
jgi:hypothetical protein